MKIEEIIQGNEGSTLEFKENVKAEDNILSTIIAFSNVSGGHVIIGINDKTRHIVGVDDPHKVSEALASKIHDAIEPRILPNIEVIPYRNTHLISIEIYPSALRPHFIRSKGKEKSTYIRIGSTTRLADQALLSVVERSTISKSFDEEICHETNCEEIDFIAASQLFEPHRKLEQSDLVSLGIIAKKGKELVPTVAGILLFGKNRLHSFADAWVQVGVFAGIDKDKILDSQKITSFFPRAVEDVLTFLKKNMRVGLKIEDTRHQELWEIPKVALREAVINAIVHTDYSLRGAPIRVAIFDDRIEIENSALLPWGLTFADLKSGVSKLRNPVIARIFNEIGLIEQWGSGIKRMTNACLEAGLVEPSFEEIGPRIRVTFYRGKVGRLINDDLDMTILGLISYCGPLSTHQITSCVDISRRSVINRLAGLVNKGQIIEIAQSPNDPKKQYCLRGEGGKRQKMNIIKEALWDDSLNLIGNINIRIELGRSCINFVFSRNIVENYFLDEGGAPALKNKALDKVREVIISDPIFEQILLNALADEKVKESHRKREIAQYHITAEKFLKKDYRKIEGVLQI
jgi:ATP-dependent DNA helicase RecG